MNPLTRITLTFLVFFASAPFVGITTMGHDRIQHIVRIVGAIAAIGLLVCGLTFIWTVKS